MQCFFTLQEIRVFSIFSCSKRRLKILLKSSYKLTKKTKFGTKTLKADSLEHCYNFVLI